MFENFISKLLNYYFKNFKVSKHHHSKRQTSNKYFILSIFQFVTRKMFTLLGRGFDVFSSKYVEKIVLNHLPI